MTVIAWDSKIIAADRQLTTGDTISTVHKLFPWKNGEIIGTLGDEDYGYQLRRWYVEGADPEKFPETQNSENHWAQIVIVSPSRAGYFCRTPDFIEVVDSFIAWGCGREVALGALEMGANAIRAVEVACKWINGCGRGCDWYQVRV